MDTNIYDRCDEENFSSEIPNPGNNCLNNSVDPVDKTLKKLDNDLCDMRVTLAESRANLIFLAQTLCNSGRLNQTEKVLLLSLEKQIKGLNCRVNESRNDLDFLDCLLH